MLITRIRSLTPGSARPEAADAPDDQVDRDAGLRGLVERADDRPGPPARSSWRGSGPGRPARAWSASRRIISRKRSRMPRGATISLRYRAGAANPVSTLKRSVRSAPRSGSAAEEPEVGVEARGARVVVAGADVHVPAHGVALAPHHQHHLGVGLEPGHAVAHVHADVFQPLRPADVVLLVEPGLQLDQHRHLLAALGGLGQQPGDAGVAAGPVERELDGDARRDRPPRSG